MDDIDTYNDIYVYIQFPEANVLTSQAIRVTRSLISALLSAGVCGLKQTALSGLIIKIQLDKKLDRLIS